MLTVISSRLRGLAGVALVGVLASSLLLALTPMAAYAYVDPRRPINFPGSAVSTSGNGLTSVEWNKFLQKNPTKVPWKVRAGAGLTRVGTAAGTGPAGIAVGGFLVGTEIGTGISSTFGIGTTSGSFWCDLTTLAAPGNGCNIGPAPDWTPNNDIEVWVPGWKGGVNGGQWLDGVIASSVYYEVLSSPAYGERGDIVVSTTYNLCNTDSATRTIPNWSYGTSQGTWTTGRITVEPGECVDVSEISTRYDARATDVRGSTSRWVLSGMPDPRWYPEGHPEREEGHDADPKRSWVLDYKCSDGAVGTVRSKSFRETDPEWPGFPTPECDPSAVAVSTEMYLDTEGVGRTEMYSADAPAEWSEWQEMYPECVDGSCELLLSRWDPQTEKELGCFANPGLCQDWFKDPAKKDNYRCTYGGKPVPLEECNAYSELFKPDPKYSNPNTGEAPAPSPSPGPGGEPEEGPGQNSDCPPAFSWTSLFNPWWYYKGVSCALTEAFVPTQTATKVQTLSTTVTTRAPVQELGSIITWLSPPRNTQRCGAFEIPVWFIEKPVKALDTCNDDPIMKVIRPLRPIFGAAIWISVLGPLAWWAWREYAPGAKGVA